MTFLSEKGLEIVCCLYLLFVSEKYAIGIVREGLNLNGRMRGLFRRWRLGLVEFGMVVRKLILNLGF